MIFPKEPAPIQLDGIVVIVGNYGSGKTEVSINLAVKQKRSGMDVKIADLDLVNPYFRTREARKPLAAMGIDVVLPPEQYLHADLPILSPLISGMIRRAFGLVVLDVGGDDVGATVLSTLFESFRADALMGKAFHVLQVINPFRPFTETVQGCLKIKGDIEKASRMKITGIIGNANLIDETTIQEIVMGYDFAQNVSHQCELPLAFITVSEDLLPQIAINQFSCPVLCIKRQLVPPWQRAVSLKQ